MTDFARPLKLSLVAIGSLILAQPIEAQTGSEPRASAAAPANNSMGQQNGRVPTSLVLQLPDGPVEFKNVGEGDGFPPWLATLLAGFLTTLAALYAVHRNNQQNAKINQASLAAAWKNAQAAINQKANELELVALEERLSSFFGPFLQLSEENKRLAQLLHERQDDPGFRTLTALLDPSWVEQASTTDKTLAKQIVENGIRLRTLIREKGGPAAPGLLTHLSKAGAHFTILELAHDGKLIEGTEQFSDYVYPRELDAVLELERQRLERRRDAIRADLAKHLDPIEELVIPPQLTNQTGGRDSDPRPPAKVKRVRSRR